MKIFGREPAAIVGALQAALVLAGLLLGLSNEQVGALALVVVAIGDGYVAWVTHDTLLGVAIGLVKAVVASFAAFGFDLDPQLVAAAVGVVTALLGLFQRTQTFPEYDPPRALPGSVPTSNVGTA